MIPADRSTTPPPENTTPPAPQPGSDQWILLALNNLSTDVKLIRAGVDGLEQRLAKVEKDILRATYAIVGAVAVLAFGWAAFEFASRYVEIQIVPR